MLGNDWLLGADNHCAAAEISIALGILPLTARVLVSRGYNTPQKAGDFLNKTHLSLHDPFLMKDMDKAAARIERAISAGERIYIYGDYDVDGVTSTALLYKYLLTRGVKCGCFIPERVTEGYGLNAIAIGEIAKKAELVITVDTGVTAISEVEYAKTLGLDIIITDHHSCREELPAACAVVNPRRSDCEYPFKELAGVGVAFKLVCALDGNSDKIMKQYGEIAALGTIADVMPVTGENRAIISQGLELMKNTKIPGLLALMELCGMTKDGGLDSVSTTAVSYLIAPRLNAAGRIASASVALDLLLAEDETRANHIAAELCEINKRRQATEQKIYEEAEERIRASSKSFSHILGDKNWHQGVIGVIASKISEKYSAPAILFSFYDNIAKGSGRSTAGFNLVEALNHCSGLLEEYGGHQSAAGLSVKLENFDKFVEKFEKYAEEKLRDQNAKISVEADCKILPSEVTLEAAEELSLLEPCGLGNKTPLFLLEKACIKEIYPLSGDKHIKVSIVSDENRSSLNAVYFGMSQSEFPFFREDICEFACSLTVNDYNNVKTPQLIIRGVRPSEQERRVIIESRAIYIQAVKGKGSVPENIIPEISHFRNVFRVLKREFGSGEHRVSVRYICKITTASEHTSLSLCTLKIILDVLEEFKLVKIKGSLNSDHIHICLLPFNEKIDLEESSILKKLRERRLYEQFI